MARPGFRVIRPDAGKAFPPGADSPCQAGATRPKGGKTRPNGGKTRPKARESRPELRTLPGQGRPAPGSGQKASRRGRIISVRMVAAHFNLRPFYSLDLPTQTSQAKAYGGGQERAILFREGPAQRSVEHGFRVGESGGMSNHESSSPGGSLKTEKDGRPPCPRTPPSAKLKGTRSPGKPCVLLLSRRGPVGSGGRPGEGACPPFFPPLTSRHENDIPLQARCRAPEPACSSFGPFLPVVSLAASTGASVDTLRAQT